MKKIVLSALAVASLAGTAMAQDLTPIGTVQFRWRERALGVTNSASIPQSVAASAANAIGTPTSTTDSIYHLVLEAFVTNTAATAPTHGFAAGSFDIVSNDLRSRATFAGASTVGNPPGSASSPVELRNLAATTAAASGETLPAGQTLLPNQPLSNNNGVFAPFRGVADIGGSFNTASIGVQNKNSAGTNAEMNGIVLGLNDGGAFSQGPMDDGDGGTIPAGPYYQQYQYSGLGAWVALAYVVLDLTDMTPRTINVNANILGTAAGDSGIRGWRGVQNSTVGDKWQLTLTSPIPTFSITVVPVPAPGAAALLGLGGLVAGRRRRA